MENNSLFSNVKFYLISSNNPHINNILQSNGASQQFYLSERVTFAISDDPTAAEVGEAQDLHAVSVVTSKWVQMSLEANKQLPFGPFHPHFAFIFSSVTAVLTEMSMTDRKLVWAMLQIRGGQVKHSLDNTVTHLITGKAEGFFYKIVKENKLDEQQLCCVTPDWVLESIRSGHMLPPEDYDPAFLRPPTPPPPPVQIQPIAPQMTTKAVSHQKDQMTKQKGSVPTDTTGMKPMRQPASSSVLQNQQKSMQKSSQQLQAVISNVSVPESLSSPPIITGTPAHMTMSQPVTDNVQVIHNSAMRHPAPQQQQNIKTPNISNINNPRFMSGPNPVPPGQQSVQQIQQQQQRFMVAGNRPQGMHQSPGVQSAQSNLGVRQQRHMQPGVHQQISAGQQGMNNFSPLSLQSPIQQMPGVVSPNFPGQLSVSMPSNNTSGGQSSLNSSGNSGTGSTGGSKSKNKSSKHAQEQALNEEEKDAIVMQNVKNILSQQHNWNKEQHVKQGGGQLNPSSGILSGVSVAQKKPKSPKSSPSRSKSPKSPKTTKSKLSQQQQLLAAQQQNLYQQPHQVVAPAGSVGSASNTSAAMGQPRQVNIVPQTVTSNSASMVSPTAAPPRAPMTSTVSGTNSQQNNLAMKAPQPSSQNPTGGQKIVQQQVSGGQNVLIQQQPQAPQQQQQQAQQIQLQQKQPLKKSQQVIHQQSIPLMVQPLNSIQQQVGKQTAAQPGGQMQAQQARQMSGPANMQLDPNQSSLPPQILHPMHSNQQQHQAPQQVLHSNLSGPGGNMLSPMHQNQQSGASQPTLQQSHLQHTQAQSVQQQAPVQWGSGPAQQQQHIYQSAQPTVSMHQHHPGQQQQAQFNTNPSVHQITRPQIMSGGSHMAHPPRPGINQSAQFVIQTSGMPPGAQIRAGNSGVDSQGQGQSQLHHHPGQGHQLTMRLSQGATVFAATQPSQQPVAIMQQQDVLHSGINRMHDPGPTGHSGPMIQQHPNTGILSGASGPTVTNNSHLGAANPVQHTVQNPQHPPQHPQVSNLTGLPNHTVNNAAPSVQSFTGLVANQDANTLNQSQGGPHQASTPSTAAPPASSANVPAPVVRVPHYVAYENDRGPKSKKECLVGCVFYFLGYNKTPNNEKRVWINVMRSYGAEILPVYDSERVTHVLLDSTLVEPDFFKQTHILKVLFVDKKRIVTIFWVNDCVENKSMEPPSQIIHLPGPFSKHLSLNYIRKQIISITGFESESPRVQALIEQTGAHFTPYLDVTNTVLVCKKPSGKKYEMAQRWNIACVNVRWLQDLYFGDLRTLSKDVDHKYLTFEEKDTTLSLDKTSPAVQEFMVGWLTPIKLTKDVWARQQELQTKFSEEEATRKRKAETALANEPKSKRVCTLAPLTEAEISLAMSCPLREIKVEIKCETAVAEITAEPKCDINTETAADISQKAPEQSEVEDNRAETLPTDEADSGALVSDQRCDEGGKETEQISQPVAISDALGMEEEQPVPSEVGNEAKDAIESSTTTSSDAQETVKSENLNPDNENSTAVDAVVTSIEQEEPLPMDTEPSVQSIGDAQSNVTSDQTNVSTVALEEPMQVDQETAECFDSASIPQQATISVESDAAPNEVTIKQEIMETCPDDKPEEVQQKASDETSVSNVDDVEYNQSIKLELKESEPTPNLCELLTAKDSEVENSTTATASAEPTEEPPEEPQSESENPEPSKTEEATISSEEKSAPQIDTDLNAENPDNTTVTESTSQVLPNSCELLETNDQSVREEQVQSNQEIDVRETTVEPTCEPPVASSHSVENNLPRVLFTGLTLDEKTSLVELVKELGGCVVETAADCTHLIANKIIRTPKFYYAIAYGKEIMSPKWIQASTYRGAWLDESCWVLEDKTSESQLGFSLAESLRRARVRIVEKQPGLFDTLEFWLSPGAKHRDICIELIKACGGIVRDRRPTQKMALLTEPKQLVICHENDSHLATYLMRTKTGNRAVHHEEFVLSGIMRQEVDYETYQIQYVLGVNSEITAAANALVNSQQQQQKQNTQPNVKPVSNTQTSSLLLSQNVSPVKSSSLSQLSTAEGTVCSAPKCSQPSVTFNLENLEKKEESMDTSINDSENSLVVPQASSSPKSPPVNISSHLS